MTMMTMTLNPHETSGPAGQPSRIIVREAAKITAGPHPQFMEARPRKGGLHQLIESVNPPKAAITKGR